MAQVAPGCAIFCLSHQETMFGSAAARRRTSSPFPSPRPSRPRLGTGIAWRSPDHPGTLSRSLLNKAHIAMISLQRRRSADCFLINSRVIQQAPRRGPNIYLDDRVTAHRRPWHPPQDCSSGCGPGGLLTTQPRPGAQAGEHCTGRATAAPHRHGQRRPVMNRACRTLHLTMRDSSALRDRLVYASRGSR